MQSNLNTSTSSSSARTFNSTNEQERAANSAFANANSGRNTHMMQRLPSANPLFPQGSTGIATDEETEEAALQELENARRTLSSLQYLLNAINRAEHLGLDKAQELFDRIKVPESKLKYLASEGNDTDRSLLAKFGGGTAICISNFARFLSAGSASKLCVKIAGKEEPVNTQLELLTAEQVRGFCNGLSTLLDDSLRSCLFSNSQLKKLSPGLNEVNDALLLQAMAVGLPRDLPSNGCLLDILSLQSRGLKAKVLGDGSRIVRAFFAHSLEIIEQWPTASGKVVSESGQLVSRQLGKTLVPLNTIKSFNLMKLDHSAAGLANRLRLGQLALDLCSEEALIELTILPGARHPDGSAIRVLPKGVEVTNIGNTIKDFLDAGYISLKNDQAQDVIIRLTKLIVQIPQTNLQARAGQTLGNCGNLLRTVYECAIRPGSSPVILQSPAFQAACASLLTSIASEDFWYGMDWYGKPDQTLANSASFLKAMYKWEQVDPQQLQAATLKLVQQIHNYGAENISEAQSVSSLLSALVVLGHLAPQGQVPALIESLLQTVAQQTSNKWPPKSRALALHAALTWLAAGRSQQANPAIDALLKAGAVTEDALPYLQAIRLRVKELAKREQEQADRLHGFQPMLRQLLAARANKPEPITLDELEAAIRQLESRVPVVLQRQPLTTVDTPAPTTTAATTIKPKPVKPEIPGLTNPISTSTAFSPSSTTRSITVKPTARRSKYDQSNESWDHPSNVIGNQKTETPLEEKPAQKPKKKQTLPSSTAPVITNRTIQTETKSNSVPKKGGSKNPAKTVSTTRLEQPVESAARELSDKARATMERQWFDVVRNKKMKGRMQVLEKLVLDYPALPTIKDSKGGKGQTALYDAMLIGDQVLVEWLLTRMPVLDEETAVQLLHSVFNAPIMVDEAAKSALSILMSKLGKPLNEQITMQFGPKAAWAPIAYRDTLNQFQANDSNMTLEELDDYEPQFNSNEEHKQAQLKKLEKSINKVKASNPLLAAAFTGDLEKVNILLNSPNAASMISGVENVTKMNPLMVAIFTNNQAIAARLLQTKAGQASALAKNSDGSTALIISIARNQISIVHLLLALPNVIEQTANYYTIDDSSPPAWNHHSPIVWALLYKNYPIARLLAKVPGAEKQALHSYEGNTLLQKSIISNDRKMLDILLAMPNVSEQINQLNEDEKRQAFNHAIGHNQADIVDLLLKHEGAEIWLTSINSKGYSPLIFALKNHFEAIAESILNSRYGEKLSLLAPFGDQTPLMSAAYEGLKRSTSILLSMSTAELQVMRVNDAGMSALMQAASRGQTEIVRDLLALRNAKDQARMLHKTPSRIQIFKANETKKIRVHQTAEASVDYRMKSYSNELGVPYKQLEKHLGDIEKSTIGMNARQIALANGHLETADLLLPFEKSGQGQI